MTVKLQKCNSLIVGLYRILQISFDMHALFVVNNATVIAIAI